LTQTQLVQKLEAIATLSGGIAHQFNNALQSVVGNIELLELELPGDEKIKKFSRRTNASTERMAHLVNQLLAYARGGKYKSEIVNLSDFVRSTLPSVTPDTGADIRIETHLSEDISDIHADKSQLRMVLTGVLTNAIEAVEEKGRIVVSTGNVEIGKAVAAGHPGLVAGSYAILKIKDDGKGMDEETKSRIFEPFFTTKSRGRGLGMSAVYGIIKNHSGYVLVDSEPGKGTIVSLLISCIRG
jgi:signal transduction histidine kinase